MNGIFFALLNQGVINMIIKPLGNETQQQIDLLNDLLNKSNSDAQMKLIKSDLAKLRNGYISEKDNAYLLDFELKDSKNILVLHDIRIEHNDRVAQIDHILISRLEVTVLESKSFSGSLTIKDDGSLLVEYGKNKYTYPNPIEQNRRHIQVLQDLIREKFNLQANTKLFGGLLFDSKVLIHPKTTITNKTLPDGFERADSYITKREKEIDNMSALQVLSMASKIMTIDKAKELGEFLIQNNKPKSYDYKNKYRIKTSQKNEVKYKCTKCESQNLQVNYGRNYYFKCLDCESNTPIKHTCKTKGCKPKTKKRKLQFFKICEACSVDELFYENKC